jgi:hypothetical protein
MLNWQKYGSDLRAKHPKYPQIEYWIDPRNIQLSINHNNMEQSCAPYPCIGDAKEAARVMARELVL